MKVLAVLRASTNRQEVESQKMELGNHLKSLGYKESEIRFESYRGASASKANKQYLLMIEDIKNICTTTEIDTVAFWHLNRLGRMKKYLDEMCNWFIEHKVQVILNNPSVRLFDNGEVSMSTKMIWSMFAIMIEEDTKELLGKFKRGKEYNKALGRYNGGNNVPFGYKVENQFIVIDEDMTDIVRNLFIKCAGGTSISYLCDWLKDSGHKMTRTAVRDILRKERYKEIVGADLFNKVQEMLSSKATKSKNKRMLMVEKKICCTECGNHFVNLSGSWSCIYHTNAYKGSEKYCTNTISAKQEVIDYIVWFRGKIKYAKMVTDESAVSKKKSERELKDCKTQQTAIMRELEKIEVKKERVEISFIEGNITKEKKDSMRSKYDDDEKMMRNKLDALEMRMANLERIMAVSDDTIDKFVDVVKIDFTKEEKYEIVQKMVKKIEVKKIGEFKHYHIVWYDGKTTDYYSKGMGKYGFRLYHKVGESLNDETLVYRDWRSKN